MNYFHIIGESSGFYMVECLIARRADARAKIAPNLRLHQAPLPPQLPTPSPLVEAQNDDEEDSWLSRRGRSRIPSRASGSHSASWLRSRSRSRSRSRRR